MKWLTIGLLVACPLLFSQETVIPVPDGGEMAIGAVSVSIQSGVPTTNGRIQNRSHTDWASYTFKISVRMECRAGAAVMSTEVQVGPIPSGYIADFSDRNILEADRFNSCTYVGLGTASFVRGKTFAERDADAVEAEARREAKRKAKEEEERKVARERAELKRKCHGVYLATSGKRIADLTVSEDRAVKGCDVLGLYE